MTLPRWLGIFILLACVIPLGAGLEGIVIVVSTVAAVGIAKAILMLQGEVTGEINVDLGGHLPGDHGHGHGHEDDRGGHADHPEHHEDHGEEHHGHDGAHDAATPPEPVTVKVPTWTEDPRLFVLMPVLLLLTGVAELVLWWAVTAIGWEWSGYLAAIPPVALIASLLGKEGVARVFEGKAAVRFFGRWIILSGKPGKIAFFFFGGLFEVIEIPLVYPAEAKVVESEPMTMPDSHAAGAQFVVRSEIRITPGKEPEDAIKIALVGGIERAYDLSVQTVQTRFSILAADPRRYPFTITQALDRRAFARFHEAGQSADLSWLGVKAQVFNVTTDAAPETKRAMESVFVADKTRIAQEKAINAAGKVLKVLVKNGISPERAERLVLAQMGWGNVILSGGAGGGSVHQKQLDMDTLVVQGSNSPKRRRRSGGGGGDE